MTISVHAARVTRLLSEVVAIPSVNPALVPGGSGEREIAEFCARVMESAGLESHAVMVAPDRYNVVGVLRGTGGGRNLLLNAHLDTVSVEGMADAFSGRVENGLLYGRGAADCKAGLAAGIEALIALKESGVRLAGDVIMAGTADEEYGSVGTEAIVRDVRADGCIIMEPGRRSQGVDLSIGVGSGGYVWAQIETRGRAAHGSLHMVGVDAIEHMGPVLVALSKLKKRLLAREPYRNPLATQNAVHCGSLHASLIKGGVDLATYPESCVLGIERRTVYGETFDQVRCELAEVLEAARAVVPGLQAEARVLFERAPWEARRGLLYDTVFECAGAELGRDPERYAVGGWDDGALTSGAGMQTVVFGPTGNDWHAAGEYCEVGSLARCARVVAETAIRFCR